MEKVIETLLLNRNIRSNISESITEIDEIFQPWGGE